MKLREADEDEGDKRREKNKIGFLEHVLSHLCWRISHYVQFIRWVIELIVFSTKNQLRHQKILFLSKCVLCWQQKWKCWKQKKNNQSVCDWNNRYEGLMAHIYIQTAINFIKSQIKYLFIQSLYQTINKMRRFGTNSCTDSLYYTILAKVRGTPPLEDIHTEQNCEIHLGAYRRLKYHWNSFSLFCFRMVGNAWHGSVLSIVPDRPTDSRCWCDKSAIAINYNLSIIIVTSPLRMVCVRKNNVLLPSLTSSPLLS